MHAGYPTVTGALAPAILGPMGFNPHHPHRRSPADDVMVAAAFVVVAALVVWAFVGL